MDGATDVVHDRPFVRAIRVQAGHDLAQRQFFDGSNRSDLTGWKVLPTCRLADLGPAAVTRHALNPADIPFLVAWTLLFGTTAAWRYHAGQQRLIGW